MYVIEDVEMSYLDVWGGIYMPLKVSLEERGAEGDPMHTWRGRQVGTKAETGVMWPHVRKAGRAQEWILP